MNFFRFIYLLLLFSLLSTASFATTMRTSVPWSDEYNVAFVTYTPNFNDYSSQEKVFMSVVSHSRIGLQRIYFRDYYRNYYAQPKTCVSTNNDIAIITFNNQAVKMFRWCKRFDDGKDFYEYIPATERGHSYVVNLFKTSTSPIKIDLGNDTIFFPVMGFTRIWNSAGGDAI